MPVSRKSSSDSDGPVTIIARPEERMADGERRP